jgi:hypothetical protein
MRNVFVREGCSAAESERIGRFGEHKGSGLSSKRMNPAASATMIRRSAPYRVTLLLEGKLGA